MCAVVGYVWIAPCRKFSRHENIPGITAPVEILMCAIANSAINSFALDVLYAELEKRAQSVPQIDTSST